MDDNLAIVLLMAMAILAALVLTLSLARMRGRHRLAEAAAGETIAALGSENARLQSEVSRLGARTAVLERIATDPSTRTAHEIEALR